MKVSKKVLIGLGILTLIIMELACGQLAYYTIGASISGFYMVSIVILNILCLFYLRSEMVFALYFMAIIGVTVIPYQLYLGYKWIILQEEGANVIGYIYKEKIEGQNYPGNLSEYEFNYPKLKENFTYFLRDDGEFELHYNIGSEGTSHYYSTEVNKWGYYPD